MSILTDLLGREIKIGDIVVCSTRRYGPNVFVVMGMGKARVTAADKEWRRDSYGMTLTADRCAVINEQAHHNDMSGFHISTQLDQAIQIRNEIASFILALKNRMGQGYRDNEIAEHFEMPIARIKYFKKAILDGKV